MAILDGLGKPTSNESAITVPCSTGNCSFPEFQGVTHTSLGLCRKCVDVSSEIFERIDFALFDGGNGTVVADPNQTAYSFELSNGQSIGPWIWRTGDGNASDAESAQIFLNTSTADFEWQSFASIALSDPEFVEAFGSAVLNFTVLSHTLSDCQVDLGSNSSETKPPLCQHSNLNLDDAFTPNFTTMFNFIDLTAASCAFYPCVKKYHVAVKDGLVEETVKEESLDRIGPVESGNILSDFLHFATPCEVAGLPYTLDNISSAPNSKNFNATLLIDGRNVTVPDNCTYRMTGVFAEALKLFLGDAFQGNCVMPLTSYFRYNSPIALWNTAQCDPWWLKNLFNKGNASFASIDQNMDAVATAATNELRRQGLDWNGLPALITGSTSRTTICNQFDWPWLAFPFALLVATTLLLFAMAIKMWCMGRSGTPGWKSSVLPLLFAADDAVRKNVALWKVSQIEKETDGLIVTLSPGDKGWTFASTRREA